MILPLKRQRNINYKIMYEMLYVSVSNSISKLINILEKKYYNNYKRLLYIF